MAVLISYDEVFLNRLEAYLMKGEKTKFLTDLVVFLRKKTMQNIPDTFVLSEADMNTIIKTKVLSSTLLIHFLPNNVSGYKP